MNTPSQAGLKSWWARLAAALLGGVGLFSAPLQAQAQVDETRAALEARVAAVREALQQARAAAANDPEGGRDPSIAQWMNWGNWPNWPNFNNWNNWNNWVNWVNWFN